jgi:hypothetical protein
MSTKLTHGLVISQKIIRCLAYAFVLLALCLFITYYTITYSIKRDCMNPYSRDIKAFGFWWRIEAGSTKEGCFGA